MRATVTRLRPRNGIDYQVPYPSRYGWPFAAGSGESTPVDMTALAWYRRLACPSGCTTLTALRCKAVCTAASTVLCLSAPAEGVPAGASSSDGHRLLQRPTRVSVTGVGSSEPTSVVGYAGDAPDWGTRGTSTRFSSNKSGACCTICGEPSTSTGSCWTSWCRSPQRSGGQALLPAPAAQTHLWSRVSDISERF